MQIFLPIAEVSVNAFTLIGLGGIVGLMSGLFGVGGGLQQFTVIDADIESKTHLMPDDLAQLHPRGVGVP